VSLLAASFVAVAGSAGTEGQSRPTERVRRTAVTEPAERVARRAGVTDLAADGLATVPPPPVVMSAVVVAGDRLVVVGGEDEVWVFDLAGDRWRRGAPLPFSRPVLPHIASAIWTGEEVIVEGPACSATYEPPGLNRPLTYCAPGGGGDVEVAAYSPERDAWRRLRAPEGYRTPEGWPTGTKRLRGLGAIGWTGREVVFAPGEPVYDEPRELLVLDPSGDGSWRWTQPLPQGPDFPVDAWWYPKCVLDGQVFATTSRGLGYAGRAAARRTGRAPRRRGGLAARAPSRTTGA
jgi:hypothetical protein